MTYIKRDGKIYEQIISEREVDLVEEEYKLQAWKDAIASDERELQEYQAKIAEIDALDVKDEFKNKLKEGVQFFSESGIKPEMVTEQESILEAIATADILVSKK